MSDQHPQHEEQEGSAPHPDLPETPEPLEFSQAAEPAHPDTPEAESPAPEPALDTAASDTGSAEPDTAGDAGSTDPADGSDPANSTTAEASADQAVATQPDAGSADEPFPPTPTQPPAAESAEQETGPETEAVTHSSAEVDEPAVAAELAEPLDHSAAAPESGEPTEPPQPLDPTAADEGIEDGLPPLSDADLDCALEALLLVVDSPVEEEALATAVDTTPLRVAEHLRLLSDKYTDQDRGIDLRRAGGGWRFYTRDRYAPYVEKLLLDGQRAKLTRAALETLAVIAYRQPVTRARVAAVRGVNCDGVIRTLLARGLVEETGTDVETGGFLYRTTELFLERLGLSSLDDLPPIAPLLPEVDSIDEL